MGETLVVERLFGSAERLVFRSLRRPAERLRGLLGTTPRAAQVALVGCSSVHTFGMRYRLDIAFVGSSGVVLGVWRSVPPGRVIGARRAWITLERPHQRGPWLVRGERVRLVEGCSENGVSDDDR